MAITLEEGNPFYYTDEYKNIIRSCKELIVARASYMKFTEPHIKFAFRNNFHKLLRVLGGEVPSIPEDLIWTISFINGIENPNQDFSHLDGIWVVNKDIIASFIQVTRVKRE